MIKALVMDVDGTLTDGKIHISENGEVFKSFNVKDGYGILHILPKLQITPIIITGRKSTIVENRAKELNINHVYQGIEDKLSLLKKICIEMGIQLNQVAYIGDDLNDIDAMSLVGLKGCPDDAVEEVKNISNYVCKANGGKGAVREFINYLNKEI